MRWPLVVLALAAACGSKKKDDGAGTGSGKPIDAPWVSALPMPALGVDAIRRMNYPYGEGADAYARAVAAYKKADWPGVKDACEAALKKDGGHLDAHRLLAVALAQLGEHAAAVDHLVSVIAADYYGYGVAFGTDKLLEGFRATPHGQAVAQLANQIRDEYAKKLGTALMFVARRSAFRYENKPGVGLNVLSLASAPLCKQAPPAVDTTGSAGSNDEMPPEEPAPSGPVTQPQ